MPDDEHRYPNLNLPQLKRDYSEFSNLRAALRVVLLASAAASGIDVVVDGRVVPTGDLITLVPWDSEDGEELNVRLEENQAELSPGLAITADLSSIELPRNSEGVSFEPLYEYLQPRVPTITSMGRELMSLRQDLMRMYPGVVEEEPALLWL